MGTKLRKFTKRSRKPKKKSPGSKLVVDSLRILNNNKTPFPRRFTRKFQYCEHISFATTAAGLPGVYQFKTNSMFDPNFTGTGHQPLFRDEMVLLYGHYRVNSMRYKITNTSGNVTMHGVVMATQDTSYGPASFDLDVSMEKRGCGKYQSWFPGQPQVSWSGEIQNYKLMSVSKKTYETDDKYRSTNTGEPSELGYLSLIIQSPQLALSQSYSFMVELEYDTVWEDPLVVASS